MSIANTDLKCYQSANMPEGDATTTGGAIATAGIIDDMVLAASDTLKVKSDSASDGAGTTCTITGRNGAGAIVSENHTLNGTTLVVFNTNTYERLLKVVLTGTTTVGNVTVYRSDGTTGVVTLPIAKTSCRRMFYDSASSGSQTVRCEKIFWKNENGSLTLTNAAMKLTADPSAKIRIGCAPSVDDSATTANRLATPSSVTFVDDNVSQAVPGNALAAASGIGVWAELTLSASDIAYKSTFTTQLSGSST